MKIKVCGLFREEGIEYVNDAGVDYAGFVFASSRREVSPAQAAKLRRRLAQGIVSVGVFVNAPLENILALYRDGVIDIAQLHGTEDGQYIARLKEASVSCNCRQPIPVIKAVMGEALKQEASLPAQADYYLVDSGAGSGKTFNWDLLEPQKFPKPWFLAGGITIENIGQAMALSPFAIDVSSGAETDGVKDREKILRLTAMVRSSERNSHTGAQRHEEE